MSEQMGESLPENQTEIENTQGADAQEPQTHELKYEKGVSLADALEKANGNVSLNDILELDKLEKFKFKGKELTVKDLEKGFMFQSDYSKKTMSLAEQRKAFEAEQAQYKKTQEFYDNLSADLKKLRANPDLIAEFKRVYPERFHAYLELVQNSDTIKEKQAIQQEPVKDPELEEMKEYFKEQRMASATEFVNATFDKMASKYTDADEEAVIAKVIRLNELHKQSPGQYQKPDEKVIENLFKASHDSFNEKLKQHHARMIAAQKDVNQKVKGPAGGGGTPSQAPIRPKNLREATEMALADLERS